MKRQYSWLGTLMMVVITVVFLSSHAKADDSSQFDQMIEDLHSDRARIEAQLGIDPNKDTFPHATCYYDDLEDHYEHDQMMREEIDKGIS